jgi:hypothetical protein
MKPSEQSSQNGIGRRSFLLRVSVAVVGVLGSGSILGRLVVKEKTKAGSSAQTMYPKIHSMAVPRKNKKT